MTGAATLPQLRDSRSYRGGVPARLKLLTPQEFRDVCERLHAGGTDRADLKAATKHLLALLERRAPGRSVEVRVPPFAAVQCVSGARHTRGTPPAVVEMDAHTWVALGTGELGWTEAVQSGRVRASGERSNLSHVLPLT